VSRPVSQGVREKLRRGFTHSDAYSVSREDVIEDEKRRWIVRVHGEPPLIQWGALIGDCLFNYRSALDHLAFDLAVAHTGYPLPEGVERRSEFPIFWRRAPTKRQLDDRPSRCPASHRVDAAARSFALFIHDLLSH
jgi:hypothetical protein